MDEINNIEMRRRERHRREMRRKKRNRAFLFILFIVILVVAGITIFVSIRSGKESKTTVIGVEASLEPVNTDIISEDTEESAVIDADSAVNDIGANLNIPSASEQNDLLKIIEEADAAGGEKTCYLTFDDGPSANVTPRILDTLRKYNIKATFFEMGASITENPNMARRVYEEGHLIANHSESHNYDKLYATEESFINEIWANEELIDEVTGGDRSIRLFRFPGGSYNAGDRAAEKQIYKNTLAENGFYYVDWNTLNGDAEGATKDADGLLAYVQKYTDTSSSAVVLMHDAAAKTATADALDSIIQYFISEGYTFKRLDEIEIPAVQTDAPEYYDDVSTE